MKIILSTLVSFCFSLAGFSQETYTARKGLRIFPGHLHIALKVDSNKVHYQLFNHWYNLSYAQYRDIKIPISELPQYGEQNDTLRIIILADKVKLVDKRNQLDLKIKHTKLCSTVETMRKISTHIQLLISMVAFGIFICTPKKI